MLFSLGPFMSTAVLVVGTLILAIMLAAWLLTNGAPWSRKSTAGPLDQVDNGTLTKESTPNSVVAVTQNIEILPKTTSKETLPKAASNNVEAESKNQTQTHVASVSSSSFKNNFQIYGSNRLWFLRIVAVQRLVDEKASTCDNAAVIEALKRNIWSFLDDRPRIVASAGVDGQSRIFNLRTGQMLVSIRHDAGARLPLGAVHLAPGPRLFTGTWDGRQHAWDEWPQKPARPVEFGRGEKGVGHENLVSGIALSRDGNILACACTAGCVLVFRANCPTIEIEFTDPEELDELREILAMGDYGELYLKEDRKFAGIQLEHRYVLLQEASFAGYQSRRDFDKLEMPARLHFRFGGCFSHPHKRSWRKLDHDGAVHCLALAAEGKNEFLYSGSRDRTVRKWALADGSCVHIYKGHTSMVRCLAVNCRYLVSGSDDRTVRVWQKQAPSLERSIVAHGDFVRAVALCPSFVHRLISVGDDMKVTLWDISKGEKLIEYQHKTLVTAAVLHESVLLTASKDGRLRGWHTETATLEFELKHPGGITALSLL